MSDRKDPFDMHRWEDTSELEIETLESVDDEADNEVGNGTPRATPLLAAPSIQTWIAHNQFSDIPCIIMNDELEILWTNTAYNILFTSIENPIGLNLKNQYGVSLESDLDHLVDSIRSRRRGYTWQGKIEHHVRTHLSITAKLLIFPFFSSSGNEPCAYSGIFVDISEYQRQILQKTFMSLLHASMLKDNDTGNHVKRVNSYAEILTGELYGRPDFPDIDRDFINNIAFLSSMHDVGKIGIQDDILNKTGPLEKWEWDIMKQHTINGAYLLSSYPNPMAREIALYHHEWWDGAGYPYGIRGGQIPIAARIVAIADVYDALRMPRKYKPPFTHEDACEQIVNQTGIHFDPFIVTVFEKKSPDFGEIYARLLD